MCKLRCGTLNFVAGGRPHMRNIVFENDLQKKVVITLLLDGRCVNSDLELCSSFSDYLHRFWLFDKAYVDRP